jgi:ribosomal protein S18 acetylase RimI-like enzyme
LPLQIGAAAQMGAKRRVLEAAGGSIVRRSFRMVVELPDEPAPQAPTLLPGVEISAIRGAEPDLRAVHSVVDVAFLDHYGHAESDFETWLDDKTRSGYADYSLWWLARVDGACAAGLIAAMSPGGGYVDTLGTLRVFRGRGLGRALMLAAFAEFHRRGVRKVMLGVDADNSTGAVELYQSLGMKAVLEGLRYEFPK